MKNYMKTCTFVHAHFTETMKIVENLFEKAYGEQLIYWKDICCRNTLELPLWGNSNVYLQQMLLKIKKKLFWNLHLYKVSSQTADQY